MSKEDILATVGELNRFEYDRDCGMNHDPSGEYVLFDDVAPLLAEIERLTEQYEKLWSDFVMIDDENEKLRNGMKGDYDLDAWLDFIKERDTHVNASDVASKSKEIRQIKIRVYELETLLGELEWGHYSSPGVYRCLLCGNAQVEDHEENCRMGITLSTSAEPSAPIDERTAFNDWTVSQGRVIGYLGWRADFEVWQARAKLNNQK